MVQQFQKISGMKGTFHREFTGVSLLRGTKQGRVTGHVRLSGVGQPATNSTHQGAYRATKLTTTSEGGSVGA